jgi:hypothetical protein
MYRITVKPVVRDESGKSRDSRGVPGHCMEAVQSILRLQDDAHAIAYIREADRAGVESNLAFIEVSPHFPLLPGRPSSWCPVSKHDTAESGRRAV